MTPQELTLDDLRKILQEGAGADEGVLSDDALDSSFGDLGFESLALLETGSLIERECGIELDDSALTVTQTPAGLIALVNEQMRAISA